MYTLDSGLFYKNCVACFETKPSKYFRQRTETQDLKRRPYCLTCEGIKRHKSYIVNKPRLLQQSQKVKENKPIEKILSQAKATAKRKNLEFNIDMLDIKLPTHCSYLGIKLTNKQGQGVVWSNYSIDRIDSTKGYIKGNIEIISRKANSMKNMATQEELIIFAKNILKLYGE